MKRKCLTAMMLALVFCMADICAATILLQDTDWSDWTADPATASPLWTGSSGTTLPSTDGAVWSSGTDGVEFSGPSTLDSIYDDLIYDSDELAVDASSYFAVTMSFWVDPAAGDQYSPDALSFYFEDADGYSWFYALTPSGSSGWQTYTVALADGSWYSPDIGAESTLTEALALGALTAVGINLIYESDIGEDQEYGIGLYGFTDEVGFTIPEPGTYMVLSVAFMSLGFSFRRREREKKDVA